MTEPAAGRPDAHETPASFYDALAPDYDTMTGFEKRFAQELPLFQQLVERFGITTALDAGAGTGFHSLLLAKLGVSLTAVDTSSGMLDRLRSRAREMALSLETLPLTFAELPGNLARSYDAVFCLGNTLAHLLTPSQIHLSLRAFMEILKPGGVLLCQLLNYDMILSRRERIQSIRDDGTSTFVRFYDYEGELIRFNVLKILRTKSGVEHHLHSVLLRPIVKAELSAALRQVGFAEVTFFGGLAMNEFLPDASRDLVAVARREAS